MDKADLIKRIKKSADYFKNGRVYEALQLIEPIHNHIQHEKVQKLYALSRKKALENLQHLMSEERYSRILELNEEFLSNLDDADFETIVASAREEIQKPEDVHLEITPEDLDPELEDPVTEVISASWAAGIASDDTQSAIEVENADEIDFSHLTESEAPVTTESQVEEFEETGMSDETDVNELIQRGVSLYEVGDVQNALRIWRNGLRFDPENVILKEYIANSSREIEDETSNVPESSPEPQVAMAGSEPDPQELSRIVAMGRAGDVDQALNALDMLEKTSGPSPKLDESREYIQGLSHQYGISTISAKVEELLSSHRAGDAVRILEQHLNEHPEHVELNDLLDTARRRMSDEPPDLNASLELDYDAKDLGGSQQAPEPVQNYSAPPRNKRKQKPIVMVKGNKHMVLIGIVVGILVVLATVAYFLVPQIRLQQFYKNFKKQNAARAVSQPVKSSMKKEQEKDYQLSTTLAKKYFNEHRYLFTYYLLLHADSIHPLKPEDRQFLNASRNEMLQKVNVSRLKRQAQRFLARRDYAGAIDSTYSILASNPDNIKYKKQLTSLYVKAGIDNVRKNQPEAAKTNFELARILDPLNPQLQKHVMVVTRLLSARIDRHQADEWFVFFQ